MEDNDAFQAGQQAFVDGVSYDDNPHEEHTREHKDWQNGFVVAMLARDRGQGSQGARNG